MHQLPKLLFIHIPKTAGISLYHALVAVYGAENCARFGDAEEFARFDRMTPDDLRRLRMISGHRSYLQFMQKGLSDYLPIAIVRDPVERLLSTWHYVRGWSGHPRHAEYLELTLDRYVDLVERDPTIARQIRFLSGADTLQEALPILERYALLAPYEALDAAVEQLSTIIGAPIELSRLNVSNKPADAEDFAPAQRERLLALMGEDVRLHDYVRERWATR